MCDLAPIPVPSASRRIGACQFLYAVGQLHVIYAERTFVPIADPLGDSWEACLSISGFLALSTEPQIIHFFLKLLVFCFGFNILYLVCKKQDTILYSMMFLTRDHLFTKMWHNVTLSHTGIDTAGPRAAHLRTIDA